MPNSTVKINIEMDERIGKENLNPQLDDRWDEWERKEVIFLNLQMEISWYNNNGYVKRENPSTS